MSERLVFIGGFASGRALVNSTGEAIAKEANYDDVDTFTLAEALSRPDIIQRAATGADIWTHSSGFMAAKDSTPRRFEAIGPPLPTSISRLLARTSLMACRMSMPGIGMNAFQDLPSVLRYTCSSSAELFSHPFENLSYLPSIAKFNAITHAVLAYKAGIPTTLHYNDCDEYFRPTAEQILRANQTGVRIIRSPGIHNELLLRPTSVLAAHLKNQ